MLLGKFISLIKNVLVEKSVWSGVKLCYYVSYNPSKVLYHISYVFYDKNMFRVMYHIIQKRLTRIGNVSDGCSFRKQIWPPLMILVCVKNFQRWRCKLRHPTCAANNMWKVTGYFPNNCNVYQLPYRIVVITSISAQASNIHTPKHYI